MCHFISIGVPARIGKQMATWRRRGFHLAEQQNASLLKALPPDYSSWLLTRGQCSCELCLQPEAETKAVRLREDAAEIVRQFGTLHTGRTFLYIHWYTGDVSTEALPIDQRIRQRNFSLAESLPLDTLIEPK